jgi:DNA integrity scanning protein DisA with diadenylate cyclase activity
MAAVAKKIDFASELAIGKPNSLGNTLLVVKSVESNPKLFPQLLKLLLHENSIVAMRAMNATKRLMRADKDFFDPQKESLVKTYSKSKHNVVRLGLITLYFDFIKEFSPSQLKSIKTLTVKWMKESEDWMILAQGLKLLEKLAKIDPKIQPELVKVAKALQKDSRKAVSMKAKKVLSSI